MKRRDFLIISLKKRNTNKKNLINLEYSKYFSKQRAYYSNTPVSLLNYLVKNNAAAPRTPPESPCFAFLIGGTFAVRIK